MRWLEFEGQQPRLAAIARDRLLGPRVVLVGTQRRDGTARISGCEPLLMEGDLWLSMMDSHKVQDLRRDPRVLVRSVITAPGNEIEILIRGRAVSTDDPAVQRRYADAVDRTLHWRPEPGLFHLFRIDLEEVSYIHFDEPGDQHVALWPAAVEYRRRHLTPTSYGPREPATGVLERKQH